MSNTPTRNRPQPKPPSPSVDSRQVDPLLTALLTVSRLHGRSLHAASLTQGLPLGEEGLTAALFARAARGAGLRCRLVKTPLARLSSLVTPAVLLLRRRQACVLTAIDQARGTAQIIMPEEGPDGREVSLAALEKDYAGHVFLVRKEDPPDKDLAFHEPADQGAGWLRRTLLSHWRIYRDVLVASLLINLFALASPLFVMNVYDRVVPNQAMETLWVLTTGVLIVLGFDFLMRLLRSYFIDLAGQKTDVLLSAALFGKVLGLKMAARPRSAGAFARNLQEYDQVRDLIASTSVTALVDLPFALIVLAVIGMVAGPLVLLPVLGMVLLVLCALCLQRPLNRSAQQTLQASANKNASLIEVLLNLENIKIAGAESQCQRRWEQDVGHIAHWGLRVRLLAATANSLAMGTQQLVTVALVVAGVYQIAAGELSQGALVAAVMLSGRVLAPMVQLAGLATRWNQGRAALKALEAIMRLPSENDDLARTHRPDFKGDLVFDRVNFCWPDQSDRALDTINLTIKAGEKVGIIGRTGSGKSTLLRLIAGLYQPESGALRLDGLDLRQLHPADLRAALSCCLQEPGLVAGSLKDNIVLGARHYDDSEVIRAARLAGVSEFSDRHPEGLGMAVGEAGQLLSGGQRQSLALARALLRDAPLVLLDEPTSAMDDATEAGLRSRLGAWCTHKTLVLVTHKLSMLELVDRLIVMDQGRILADGPRQQILDALRQGKLRTG